jgi:hypothetical protein
MGHAAEERGCVHPRSAPQAGEGLGVSPAGQVRFGKEDLAEVDQMPIAEPFARRKGAAEGLGRLRGVAQELRNDPARVAHKELEPVAGVPPDEPRGSPSLGGRRLAVALLRGDDREVASDLDERLSLSTASEQALRFMEGRLGGAEAVELAFGDAEVVENDGLERGAGAPACELPRGSQVLACLGERHPP